jgi:branched-chain amino acid transport system permease protein
MAGSLRVLSLSFLPAMGVDFLIYAFAVVVIGGMGSFKGSIYGSLIVAVSYSFGVYFIPQYAMIFVFALLFITLIISPRGLFGVKEAARPASSRIDPQAAMEVGPRAAAVMGGIGLGAKMAIALALVLLPLLIGEFWLFFATELLLLALLATSLNMLLRTGLLSLSHAAFFGMSAYTSALILKHVTASIWLALPAGMLVAAVFALIVGALSLRHIDIYFSLLTLAFAQFLYAVVYKWQALTGGDDGLIGMRTMNLSPAPGSGGFPVNTPVRWYYLVLIIIAVCAWVMRKVLASPFGQALFAIGQNTQRVSFLGLNPKAFKLGAFVIAGVFAGAAGALFSPLQGLIGPSVAYWTKSIDPLFMNLIGGINSYAGPSLGAVIYMIFREYLSSWTEYWKFWLGLSLVVIPLIMPLGATYFLNRILGKTVSVLFGGADRSGGRLEGASDELPEN